MGSAATPGSSSTPSPREPRPADALRTTAEQRIYDLEAALGPTRGRFEATCEQAAIGIAHQTLDERWMWVNQRFCDIVGWPRAELMARTLESITHPDDVEASREFARRARAGECSQYTMEKRYIRKDGEAVWVSLTVSPVHGPAGVPSYFVGFVQDITDRKRAEAALRESEERFRALSEAALEGILIHDHGVVLDANPGLTRIFGYELAELVGRNSLDYLVAPESRVVVL